MAGEIGEQAWRDFFGDTRPVDVGPIRVGGATVGKGSLVRIRPTRRADAMDMFLVGRRAVVEGIFRDVDEETYVALSLDDDSGELHGWYGRYYYFHPDEIEPLEGSA